jgi:hypothetical protein
MSEAKAKKHASLKRGTLKAACVSALLSTTAQGGSETDVIFNTIKDQGKYKFEDAAKARVWMETLLKQDDMFEQVRPPFLPLANQIGVISSTKLNLRFE